MLPRPFDALAERPRFSELASQHELIYREDDRDERQITSEERTEQEIHRAPRTNRGRSERVQHGDQRDEDRDEDAARDRRPLSFEEEPRLEATGRFRGAFADFRVGGLRRALRRHYAPYVKRREKRLGSW